ncbi:hypothetical protein ES703_41479 [subsurface metagenome]|nr:hypothetical protein [Dehalococcoidia bacterium]
MSREYTRQISVIGNVASHGPVILFDDFESLLKWGIYSGEGDSIFELDPTLAYYGNQSLYMKSRTTDAAEDDIIGANRRLYMSPALKLNQAVHFLSPDFTKINKIVFYFTLADGAVIHYPTVVFDPNTPLLQYHDFENNPQTVPGTNYKPAINTWHRLQLLANLVSNRFIGITLDSHFYDLSPYSLYTYANPASTRLDIYLMIYTAGAAPAELYIDDFLIHEL